MLTKNQWSILRWSLEELADEKRQTMLWAAQIPGEMSTYEETICQLFDDSGLTYNLRSTPDRLQFSKQFIVLAEQLSDAVKSLDANQAAVELLKRPELVTIRSLAAELLRILPDVDT